MKLPRLFASTQKPNFTPPGQGAPQLRIEIIYPDGSRVMLSSEKSAELLAERPPCNCGRDVQSLDAIGIQMQASGMTLGKTTRVL